MSSGGSSTAPCQGSDVPVPKRLVRLSFNQISNAVRSLTNETLATTIATTYEIGDSEHRTFPPLASPREGSVFTDSNWAKGDKIAADVGKYIADNAATVTNCGATPSADCAKAFVLSFAERAFRRPLNDPEKANLAAVLSTVTAVSGTAAQQLQYGVYAVLESPYFLYRTELGQGATAPGPLAAYEVASQLSFFLTDAPPDPPLLEAAAQNALTTPEQVTAQVKRILALPAAQQNLQDAIFSYFGLYGLENVIINSPEFTEPVRNSMLHESELFLKNNLWAPKLTDMLTTRKSTINATLAPLYGAPVPTAGLDADGFGTTSHLINGGAGDGSSPGGTQGDLLQFLANVQTWYNSKHAAVLKKLKNAKDSYGNSLLDHTLVPYVTEVAYTTHEREPLPAFLFGGKALGMTHGSYYDFTGHVRHHNDFWITVAQGYLGADALSKLSAEKFDKQGVKPVQGVWAPPV